MNCLIVSIARVFQLVNYKVYAQTWSSTAFVILPSLITVIHLHKLHKLKFDE